MTVLTIENHALYADGVQIAELPRLPLPAEVRAWQVPGAYREGGFFVSTSTYGQPHQVPASASKDTLYLGTLDLDSDDDAAQAAQIADARADAFIRINSEYERRTLILSEGYPASEQQSWSVQISEADIVLGDDSDPTPWIDHAAPARGIGRVELAQLIKTQDIDYRQYHGTLTGARQALRDQIATVPDGPDAVIQLAAIQWPETEA